MKKLRIKFIGQYDYIGNNKYEIYEEEKIIATIISRLDDITKVASEYLKLKKETDIIIEYI